MIVDFLEDATHQIDQLITKVEAAIDRLQEYRTALITAAVTGKINVRLAAGRCSRTNTDRRTYTDNHGRTGDDTDGHGQAERMEAGHG